MWLRVKVKHGLIRSWSLNSQLFKYILFSHLLSFGRVSHQTDGTLISKCVWEAEIRPDQCLLWELWLRTLGSAKLLQCCAIDKKWVAVFHRSCRVTLRTRRNRRIPVHEQLLGWVNRVVNTLCKWEKAETQFSGQLPWKIQNAITMDFKGTGSGPDKEI